MGFFGFVFWMVVLWLAFKAWRRWERRNELGRTYGPYEGWYDSGEFYGRRGKRIEPKVAKAAEDQQAYIEGLERRVSDLEERLDFTERLLAERRELVSQGEASS